jgi:hypothetical protein
MNTFRRRNDIDQVFRSGLAILVALALLIGGYSMMHYAAAVGETQAELAGSLPANYRDTLKAMLVSAGASCRRVCALDPAYAAGGQTAYRVTCGTAETGDACATTQAYMIKFEASPVPSR